MKKIILILFCFLLTGCYNYTNLNDLAIITSITIDYQDNEYLIGLEIRENKKNEDNSSVLYYGKGSSFNKAIQNIALKTKKIPFFIDLDALIISENITEEKLDSIFDYLTRENNFSFNFKVLMAKNPKEIVKTIKQKKIIAGETIKNIMNSKFNSLVDTDCGKFLENYISSYKDIIIPYIEIQNDEAIINKAVSFNNKKIAYRLNNGEVTIYNMLNKENSLFLFNIKYDNKDVIYKTFNTNLKIKYKNNKLIISGEIIGVLDEIENIDIENKKNIKKIQEELKKEISKEIDNFITNCIKNDTDPLGLKKYIYNKTRNKKINLNEIKYGINPTIIIDRKGLIFNSIGAFKNEK